MTKHHLFTLRVLLILALHGATPPSHGQVVGVLDSNADGVPFRPYVYLEPQQPTLGGYLFFRGGSDDGEELWVTNGTSTFLDNELAPGATGSLPDIFAKAGPRIFFTASHPDDGRELYSTLGPLLTSRVTDLDPAPGVGSNPSSLTEFDGDLYFSAAVGGQRSLHHLAPTSLSITALATTEVEVDYDTRIVDDNSRVYFFGTSLDDDGEEVWASDGTELGTEEVTALGCPDWGELLGAGTSVFVVCDYGSLTELLRVDTSAPSGVSLVRRFGDNTVEQLTPSGGTLYLVVNDEELWTYDGTNSPTLLQSFPGHDIENLVRYQGNLLFRVQGELHWTDGTSVVTLDVNPSGQAEPTMPRVHAAKAYFVADDGSHGRELWKTDGTLLGTEMVVDLEVGPEGAFIEIGPSAPFGLVFRRSGGGLWITDGTALGTEEILFPDSFASDPSALFVGGPGDGALFFAEDRGVNEGDEPAVSDGTLAGTVALADLLAGSSGSRPTFHATLPNGKTLLTARTPSNGDQLWATEGVPGDFIGLGIIDPDGLLGVSGELFGDHWYFCADDDISGEELWRTDGTPPGTELFADINPSGDSSPCDFLVFEGELFFGANDGSGGGLWKTDGTFAGTVEVTQLNSDTSSFERPRDLTLLGGQLYFTSDDDVHGRELWRSDGTETGTQMLIDLVTGPDGSNPSDLMAANGLLYFAADDLINGQELWRTNGTAAGTWLVADVDPGDQPSSPRPRAPLNGGLVFTADSKLLFTDGTAGDFDVLLDGGTNPSASWTALWQGQLYLQSYATAVSELWRTDGTVGGTEIVDVEAGGLGSYPGYLASTPDRLYFAAYDADTKREIHFLEYPLFADGFESGNLAAWSTTSP